MSPLSDFFPDDLQFSRFKEKIEIGSVIKHLAEDTEPPKHKRMIVIGKSSDGLTIATIYFNSDLNTNFFRSKRMQDLQIPFEQQGREYLEWDSYLDCSKLHVKQLDKLKAEFYDSELESLGKVSQEDLDLIKGKLISAATISLKQKKEYGLIKF